MRHLSIRLRSESRHTGLSLLALLVTLGLAAGTAPATPQAPSGSAGQTPQAQGPPIRVGVDLVSMYATVRDGKKRLVPDLGQNDFQIFEDGQAQKIEYFSHESKLPITLGILMDTSGSMSNIFGAEQDAASRFLHRILRKGDVAFVISFDLDVDLLSDVSEDSEHLERAIHRARINAPGAPPMVNPGPFPQSGPKGTNFYDAVYLACTEKLAQEAGRKALVILTDAEDNGSKVRLEDAIEVAQRTDTVVHIIHISDPRFYGFGANGASVAKKMAEETGGRAIFVNSEKNLEAAFDQISEELRSQYTLGYYPINKTRDGKFRKIKVETTRSGLKVLARKGYYAPKN